MGIFNIKSLKDKYAWGSSEEKTNSAETTEEHPATVASSSANIADGVRSLIKSNPELAGKNRRGVAGRTITPDGSLREAIGDHEVRSPSEVAAQEVAPEEELSADGTATVSAQPLTHTDIEATPGDILDVDGKPAGPSIIRVGQHNAPIVDAEELANPEEANSQSAGNTQSSPATNSRGERTPLFKFSPKTLNRTDSTDKDGPFEALFVCTGNIARSASGEVIAKHLAAEYGLEDKWIFASAGTGALVGHGVYEHVANELIERGYNPKVSPPVSSTARLSRTPPSSWSLRRYTPTGSCASGPSTTPRLSYSSRLHESARMHAAPSLSLTSTRTALVRSIATSWKTPTAAAPQQQRSQWTR